MDRCDRCNVKGSVSPLFTRLREIDGERICLLLCRPCQDKSNEELREQIALWRPPYDRRAMGVGA